MVRRYTTLARTILKYLVLLVILAVVLPVVWLRWESHQPRDDWFNDRQGRLTSIESQQSDISAAQISETVRLTSDSGLKVSFRVIREAAVEAPIPVMVILGGHRTGSDAVDLFGDVHGHAILGVDYPYDGPEKVKGLIPIATTIPKARQAILDIVPAVSLMLDWLHEQPWVDRNRIVVVGASLGVPFAASAASRDERISGIMLVHGAADVRLWLEVQVARRIEPEYLHYPMGTVLYWLAYGPVFDTGQHVANLTPRPVLIVGARDDERTPAGQTEVLFEASSEPKRLRYTEGQHIQPNRTDIVADLLRIAEEEWAFLTQ